MMGMVFTSFVEMIEKRFSAELADTLLTAANLPNAGAYTAVGYYPFSEMQTLVGLLAEHSGQNPETLLEQFGEHLFNDIIASHAHVLGPIKDLLNLLEYLDGHIHREVRKLYPNAQLPSFTVVSREPSSITLRYNSPRKLEALARGLIHGAAHHFAQQASVSCSGDPSGDTLLLIEVIA